MIHHQIEKKKKKIAVEKNSKTHLSQKHTHTLPEILIYCFNQNTNPTRPISRNIMSAYGVTLSLILLLCLANEVNYSEAHVSILSNSCLFYFFTQKSQGLIFHRSLKFSCEICYDFLWVLFELKSLFPDFGD